MPTIDQIRTLADVLGTERGTSAASWTFDGNTTDATYRAFLAGFEDGDPEVLDIFAAPTGWLSGEYADTETPNTLAARLGIEGDDDLRAEAEDQYESSADAAYWAELLRVANYQTESE